MNFQQCRYVQTIAETGSFSKAAKKLFLTQPNLSASIRDLEEELGVQLFERSNTGAKLTDDGHDFLKYAKRILGELDLLEGRFFSFIHDGSLLPYQTGKYVPMPVPAGLFALVYQHLDPGCPNCYSGYLRAQNTHHPQA